MKDKGLPNNGSRPALGEATGGESSQPQLFGAQGCYPHLKARRILRLGLAGFNVGALIIRIGFGGVPYYTYGILYPQTLF